MTLLNYENCYYYVYAKAPSETAPASLPSTEIPWPAEKGLSVWWPGCLYLRVRLQVLEESLMSV